MKVMCTSICITPPIVPTRNVDCHHCGMGASTDHFHGHLNPNIDHYSHCKYFVHCCTTTNLVLEHIYLCENRQASWPDVGGDHHARTDSTIEIQCFGSGSTGGRIDACLDLFLHSHSIPLLRSSSHECLSIHSSHGFVLLNLCFQKLFTFTSNICCIDLPCKQEQHHLHGDVPAVRVSVLLSAVRTRL